MFGFVTTYMLVLSELKGTEGPFSGKLPYAMSHQDDDDL